MNRMIKPRIVSIGDIIHGQLEFTLKILSKKEPTEFYCAIPSDAFVVSDTKGVALVNTITERFCELLSLQNSCKGIYVEKALQIGHFTVLSNELLNQNGRNIRKYVEANLEFK
ncbi:hypothetical protein FGO68_gene17475 [Halteria grandinella]|uniref:Uncharacterized protein n=1 Tax=Halteria grandinella TaxID=5974 RepID=A0A8J8T7A6_HALGN|nr:hypothetical protein FGO68_gene17475 [Halteria grandinella]